MDEIERLKQELAQRDAEIERLHEVLGERFASMYAVQKQASKSRYDLQQLKVMVKMLDDPEGEEAASKALDDAFREAEAWLDMAGVPSEEEDPDEWNAAYEERFHCSACTMRGIGNILVPAIERYIAWARTHPVEKAD